MKKIMLLALLLIAGSFVSADLIASPTSATYSQSVGTEQTYFLRVNNTGNYTETSVHSYFAGSIPSSWITLPGTIPSIYPNQSLLVSYTVDIPSSASTGSRTGEITFTGSMSSAIYDLTLNVVTAASSTTTTLSSTTTSTTLPTSLYPLDPTEEYWDVGATLEFGDYQLKILNSTGTKTYLELYDDGDYITKKWCYEGAYTTLLSNKVIVYIFDSKSTKAELTVYSTDADWEVQLQEGSGSGTFPYTLISGQTINVGSGFNFGSFYMTLQGLGYNGMTLSIYQGYGGSSTYSCTLGQECIVHDDLQIIINGLAPTTSGGGSATLTIKSKARYLVSPYGGGGTTPDTPNTITGDMIVSIAGGSIGPGHKVYFTVTTRDFQPIPTGTMTIDAGTEPQTTDISNGLAKVSLPVDLTCPLGVTVSSRGYQTTTQIFSSCTEEGRINITIDGDNGDMSGTPTLVVAHNGTTLVGNVVTITVTKSTTGELLKGVKLEISLPSGTKLARTTDSQGSTQLIPDVGGDYSIIASKTGYDDASHSFTVSRKTIDVSLNPSDPRKGDSFDIITNSDGDSLSDANVEVRKPSGEIIKKASSSSGKVSLTAEEIGNYKVTTSKDGYDENELNFEVKGKQMQVAVTPSQPTCGDSISVITRDSQNNIMNPTYTINGVIVSFPYTIVQEGQYQLTAEKPDYEKTDVQLSVSCPARLVQLPQTTVTVGTPIYARFDRVTDWTLDCSGHQLSKRGDVVHENLSRAANCTLSWGGPGSPIAITVNEGGFLNFGSFDTTWLLVGGGIITVVFLLYKFIAGGIRRGGSMSEEERLIMAKGL